MRCVIYLRVSTQRAGREGGRRGRLLDPGPARGLHPPCPRRGLGAGGRVRRPGRVGPQRRPAAARRRCWLASPRTATSTPSWSTRSTAWRATWRTTWPSGRCSAAAGVALVSVTENVEETASGRLVEGIHALMAEFYSANLASEIKKGMSQKAKLGGFPHGAPLGYLNVREVMGGRQVARIVPDPERAPLITAAFELLRHGRMDPATPRRASWPTGASPTGASATGPPRPRSPGRDWPRSSPNPVYIGDRGMERHRVSGHPRAARRHREVSTGSRNCSRPAPHGGRASASTPTT